MILFDFSNKRVPWILCFLVGLFALPLAPQSVGAQTTPTAEQTQTQKAREHYLRGRAHHDAKQYDDAISEYLRAYELSQAPKLLFNLGQVYRLKGDARAALEYYQRYLAAEPSSEISKTTKRYIGELRKEIAAQKAPLETEEAPTAQRDDRETLQAGQLRQIAPGSPQFFRLTAYATAGVGLIAIAAGGFYHIRAGQISSEISDSDWLPEKNNRFRQGESAERRMKILYGIGATSLILTGASLAVARILSLKAPRVAMMPDAYGTGAGIVVTGTF